MDSVQSCKQLASSISNSRLFQPIRVGSTTQLAHRVVFAPLTRYRANKAHVPTDLHVEYYSQRASVPGTLLITEATYISPNGAGQDNVPGIWSEAQIAGWRRVRHLSLPIIYRIFNLHHVYRLPMPFTLGKAASTCKYGLSGAPPNPPFWPRSTMREIRAAHAHTYRRRVSLYPTAARPSLLPEP